MFWCYLHRKWLKGTLLDHAKKVHPKKYQHMKLHGEDAFYDKDRGDCTSCGAIAVRIVAQYIGGGQRCGNCTIDI